MVMGVHRHVMLGLECGAATATEAFRTLLSITSDLGFLFNLGKVSAQIVRLTADRILLF